MIQKYEQLLEHYGNKSYDFIISEFSGASYEELSTKQLNVIGAAFLSKSRYVEAEKIFRRIIQINANAYFAYNNLGTCLENQSLFSESEKFYREAIDLHPDYTDAKINLANLLMSDRYQSYHESQMLIDQVLKKEPFKDKAVRIKIFNIKKSSTGFTDLEIFDELSHLRPEIIFYEIGQYYDRVKAKKKAVENYFDAIKIDRKFAPAYWKIANFYKAENDIVKAIAVFRRLISLEGDKNSDNYNFFGLLLRDNNQLMEAEKYLKIGLEYSPESPHCLNSLGLVYAKLQKHKKAEEYYRKAIIHKKDTAYDINLGSSLIEQGKLNEAKVWLDKSLSKEYNDKIFSSSLLVNSRLCDWSRDDEFKKRAEKIGIEGEVVPTFPLLFLEDNPENQLKRALKTAEKFIRKETTDLDLRKLPNQKIKIGYFSADFHNHPTIRLLIGVLESHDKNKFEICVFSFGPDSDHELRRRTIKASDSFFEVREKTNEEILKLSRDKNIDIAVDLNGFTKNQRTEIFALRLAPVQINFLGYPSTLGCDFIDYIVADKVVIPPHLEKYYHEKIIRLPGTYQCTDKNREKSTRVFSRKECGLPEDGFVFCCFNQPNKITREVFEIWMSVLRQKEDSVLWLIAENDSTTTNLRKFANTSGVDGARLVFAPKMSQGDHINRHKLADLFVDTFYYNAHTTASDSLWAGVPIVTKLGNQFAARVAASILKSHSLDELITSDNQEYENLILDLSNNPARLNILKQRIALENKRSPLFDTILYTRNLEAGFSKALELHLEKKSPSNINL